MQETILCMRACVEDMPSIPAYAILSSFPPCIGGPIIMQMINY